MIRNYRKLFEAKFVLDFVDEFDHSDEIKMAGYKWSKVGRLDGHDLYLCDNIVDYLPFSYNGSNDWKRSYIREWLNAKFYYKFDLAERYEIVRNEDGDNIFLLSRDEYNKFKKNIKRINKQWWLRTPGKGTSYISSITVLNDGFVDDYGSIVRRDDIGIRPALLLQ